MSAASSFLFRGVTYIQDAEEVSTFPLLIAIHPQIIHFPLKITCNSSIQVISKELASTSKIHIPSFPSVFLQDLLLVQLQMLVSGRSGETVSVSQ